jgi:hypothetical protein
MFVDPENGNYHVNATSPALKLGFKNFSMNEFGHQLTRVLPFGGEFEQERTVKLVADKRAGEEATIYFTIDGSEPNIHSIAYTGDIQLKSSTQLKARTFNADGMPVGFTTEAIFTKVDKVVYPSWYSTLIAGENLENGGKASVKALEMEVFGALLVNIADDPDLIDATGGYNFGCYIKSLDTEKAKMWLEAGLERDWVIQQINGEKVQNIADLERYMKKCQGQTIVVTAHRDYNSKEFKVKID